MGCNLKTKYELNSVQKWKNKNREIKILPFADAEVNECGGIGRSLVSLKALAKGL